MKDQTPSDKTRTFLAYFYPSASFLILLLLCFHVVPKENEGLLDVIFGVFLAMCKDSTGYFFNTSKGSTDKDAVIANSSPVIAPIVAPDKPKEVIN